MENNKTRNETEIISNIRYHFDHHIRVIEKTLTYTNILTDISIVVNEIIKCFNQENIGRVFFFGNGGSAADSQHLAAEFTNRFSIERNPLPAIALTTDTSALTAISNDYSFEEVYSKQLQALARKGDVVIGISTSGNSKNVLKALQVSKEIGCFNVLMGGKVKNAKLLVERNKFIDKHLNVDSTSTARIQECHILIGHIICRMIDTAIKCGEIKGFSEIKKPEKRVIRTTPPKPTKTFQGFTNETF